VQDLAGILAPNQISVHNFKNRISYLAHTVKETTIKLVLDMKDWRKHRAERKKRAKEQKIIMKAANTQAKLEQTTGSDEDGVKPPASRLRGSLEKLTIQAREIKTKGHSTLRKFRIEAADNPKDQHSKNKTQGDSHKLARKKLMLRREPPVVDDKKLPAAKERISVRNKTGWHKQKDKDIKPPVKNKEPDKTTSISKFFKKEQGAGNSSILEQAKKALEQDQAKKVENILVPYIVKHPKDTAAYMMLGKAAICRKDWTEAAEIFEQVTRIRPETKGCYAALGEAAYEAGNLTKAIEALQRAHDQNPQDIAVIKRLIKIATRLDNQPMQRSLTEELKTLVQDKVPEDQAL
jgi:tetratricopeptide (TPR) repeat protein